MPSWGLTARREETGTCSGSFENGGNHCASLQKNCVLQPGQKAELIFLMGEGDGKTGAAMLGRGSRAMKFYNALCPALQNDKIEVRRAEPYSYCQFVAGRDHTAFGRAHHPFMTGSAGWAYYAATQYLLGIRPEFDQLVIDPCIPGDWPEFTVRRKWRGAEYQIHVTNPDGVEKGVASLRLNGQPVDALSPQQLGSRNVVEAVMGRKGENYEKDYRIPSGGLYVPDAGSLRRPARSPDPGNHQGTGRYPGSDGEARQRRDAECGHLLWRRRRQPAEF